MGFAHRITKTQFPNNMVVNGASIIRDFIFYILDNNLTHDERCHVLVKKLFDNLHSNQPSLDYNMTIYEQIGETANIDQYRFVLQTISHYDTNIEIKQDEKQHIREVEYTRKCEICGLQKINIFTTSLQCNCFMIFSSKQWIFMPFDEFAYLDFLTIENVKYYIRCLFELKHRKSYNQATYNVISQIHDFVNAPHCCNQNTYEFLANHMQNNGFVEEANKTHPPSVKNCHNCLSLFQWYRMQYAKFVERKRVVVALCEEVYDNYSRILAERVLSNIYIMERVYRFL